MDINEVLERVETMEREAFEPVRYMDFLRQCRTDAPALAAEVRRLRAELASEREACILWLLDRSGQYEAGSGFDTCCEERAAEIRRGEHVEALKHGELDDLREAPHG